MRKSVWLFVVSVLTVLALSACGSKSQEEVVEHLTKKVEKYTSYKAKAKMTLKMGMDPQTYDIEVWHNKPEYYRVNLKHEGKSESQMILKNDSGVYVLTPALNKSYKFQSDWPENTSQAYLYESLVKDILEDPNAKFKETKENYVFETKTRYQDTKMLPYQEITFNKKDLSPKSVKVMDPDRNTLVTVEFSEVSFDVKFDKDAFDTKKNMTGAQLEIPVSTNENDNQFTVKYPMAELPGVTLVDEKEVVTENGKRVVLTYGGEKSFTIVQQKVEVMPAATVSTVVNGKMVDLGFTIGAMNDHSITWMHDGVEYMLASTDLSPEEMVMLAKSVQGDMVK
jgi:outer membrane lipoprotein-sorting protein